MKSIKIAYLLWLCGGFLGLHLFYLGRYKQAVVYFVTLGGLFVGVICDLFSIPDYINEINDNEEYLKSLKKEQSRLKTPLFKANRFFGSLGVGIGVSYILSKTFLPTDFYPLLLVMTILTPFVISVLVYLVTTEGPMKARYGWSLIGSYIGFIIDYLRNGAQNYYVSILMSAVLLNWNIDWDFDYKETKRKKSWMRYVLLAVIGGSFLYSCCLICIINNVKIEKNGRNVTIRESIIDGMDNDDVKKLKQAWEMLYNFYQAHGLRKLIDHVFYGGDPDAVDRAYKTLEVNSRTPQNEIDQRCKTLSRKWHPDKYKDPEEKRKAEKMFMDIQQSCNVLSELRQSKIKKNQKPDEEF